MVMGRKPDPMCVFTYVQSLYNHLRKFEWGVSRFSPGWQCCTAHCWTKLNSETVTIVWGCKMSIGTNVVSLYGCFYSSTIYTIVLDLHETVSRPFYLQSIHTTLGTLRIIETWSGCPCQTLEQLHLTGHEFYNFWNVCHDLGFLGSYRIWWQ